MTGGLTRAGHTAARLDESLAVPPTFREHLRNAFEEDRLTGYLNAKGLGLGDLGGAARGIFALPPGVLSQVTCFLGRCETKVLLETCRAASAFDGIEKSVGAVVLRPLVLEKNPPPTRAKMFEVHCKTEKLIEFQGVYMVEVDGYQYLMRRPLFSGPSVSWEAAIDEATLTPSPEYLPHIQSLEFPSGWRLLPLLWLHELRCPYIREFYAPNADLWDEIDHFLRRHEDTLQVFVVPSLEGSGSPLEKRVGTARRRLCHRPLDMLWPRLWQYALCYRFDVGQPVLLPQPEGVQSVSAIGVRDGMGTAVYVDPRGTLEGDWRSRLRVLHVWKPFCQVLEDAGRKHARLHAIRTLACDGVHSCPYDVGASPSTAYDMKQAFSSVESVVVDRPSFHIYPPQEAWLCVFAKTMLRELGFQREETGSLIQVSFRREPSWESAASLREAQLCTSILKSLPHSGKLLYQGVVPLGAEEAKCEHHKALDVIMRHHWSSLSWYAKSCTCNLSWNMKLRRGVNFDDEACIRSPPGNSGAQREALESYNPAVGRE